MIPKVNSNPQAKDWNRYWGSAQTKRFFAVSWSKRRIMDCLKPFTGRGKRVLDAGCGSGFFSAWFCDTGAQTVSLDYSDEALAVAGRLTGGRSRLLKGDLLHDNLQTIINDRFDLIFSDGLLEHFVPDEQDLIIQNLKSVLAPDGVLVTFVPNRWSPWELIRPFYMPGIKETPFILPQLIALNERNGLTVTAKGGINTFPFAFSPDQVLGSFFGMLLYSVAQNKTVSQ